MLFVVPLLLQDAAAGTWTAEQLASAMRTSHHLRLAYTKRDNCHFDK
jgi:hypothetical protein